MVKLLLRIFFGKEDAEMMAMLWTQRIICGDKNFSDVPDRLKAQVKALLIQSGLEELVTE